MSIKGSFAITSLNKMGRWERWEVLVLLGTIPPRYPSLKITIKISPITLRERGQKEVKRERWDYKEKDPSIQGRGRDTKHVVHATYFGKKLCVLAVGGRWKAFFNLPFGSFSARKQKFLFHGPLHSTIYLFFMGHQLLTVKKFIKFYCNLRPSFLSYKSS